MSFSRVSSFKNYLTSNKRHAAAKGDSILKTKLEQIKEDAPQAENEVINIINKDINLHKKKFGNSSDKNYSSMNVTGHLDGSPFKSPNFDQSEASSPMNRNIDSKQGFLN